MPNGPERAKGQERATGHTEQHHRDQYGEHRFVKAFPHLLAILNGSANLQNIAIPEPRGGHFKQIAAPIR